MAVKFLRWRIRGDWNGIITCTFVFFCWSFAFYCSVFTIIGKFFLSYPDAQQALLTGHVVISLLTLLTMVLCILSDPGKLLEVKGPELLGWQFCETCQKHRPPRSHHCRRCAKCIRKMDHHCPWINNCVGEDNNMRFTQFLLFTSLMSWSCFIMSLAYFLNWLPICNVCQEENNAINIKIEISCLAFISAAFAVFTAFMFFDRMIMITADLTTIELMKDRSLLGRSLRNPAKQSWYRLFSRVFGTSNIACWFIPCRTTQIRPSYQYDSYTWQDCV